ncbi:MAG TPA: FAD-dependent oxidoreductase, partial [Candidatus Limnocylindrales bacterium]
METFDFVIIGAGPAGEAAANEARALGASVAVIDRLWFGGSCPHIGCLPSKSLLHGAAEHAANHSAYSWKRASERRDYMINRPAGAEEPDDSSHVKALETIGAVCYRGSGRIVGHGKVEIRH